MASKNTINTVDGDTLIINALAKQLRYDKTKTKTMLELAKHGVIAVETFVELAISKVGKLERSNVDGQDFVDGSDAKKGTVHTHSHGKKTHLTRECVISNLKNKNGALRVVIADPFVKDVFYFKIPHEEIKGRKQINFIFNFFGGKPEKFNNPSFSSNEDTTLSWRLWNEYRVNTFKELCQ